MALQLPAVATPEASLPASFDERWAAWEAKGAAHERAVRRKVALVAPMVIVVIAAIAYALFGR